MSLEDSTLKIGNLEFKGIYIALVATIASAIGGGVWTASTLYGRLEAVEQRSIPNIEPLTEKVAIVEQQLADNDVSELQGKLATLGVNLETIIDQQTKLLTFQDKVVDLDKAIAEMETTVKKAELVTADSEALGEKLEAMQREINDLWQGLDYLSNPLEN